MNRILLSLLTVVILSGCGIIGVLSPTERFQGTDRLSIERSNDKIYDLIAEVGKDMGMGVSELNRPLGRISLTSSGSGAGTILVGSINSSTLTVHIAEDRKILEISTMVLGNFGTGNQEAATKLTEEFKGRLLEKLKHE
jgi:hypothetical protein